MAAPSLTSVIFSGLTVQIYINIPLSSQLRLPSLIHFKVLNWYFCMKLWLWNFSMWVHFPKNIFESMVCLHSVAGASFDLCSQLCAASKCDLLNSGRKLVSPQCDWTLHRLILVWVEDPDLFWNQTGPLLLDEMSNKSSKRLIWDLNTFSVLCLCARQSRPCCPRKAESGKCLNQKCHKRSCVLSSCTQILDGPSLALFQQRRQMSGIIRESSVTR